MSDIRLWPDYIKVSADPSIGVVAAVLDPETSHQVTVLLKAESAIKAGEYLIACGRGLLEREAAEKRATVQRERPQVLDS